MKEETKKKIMWWVQIISSIVVIILNVRKIVLNEKAEKRDKELWSKRIHDLDKNDELTDMYLKREEDRLNQGKERRCSTCKYYNTPLVEGDCEGCKDLSNWEA